jgi:hypothetical protein
MLHAWLASLSLALYPPDVVRNSGFISRAIVSAWAKVSDDLSRSTMTRAMVPQKSR